MLAELPPVAAPAQALFLPYLSSAFVPLDTLPAGLRWFAQNQPLTPVIESIRSLLLGTDPGAAPFWAVGWTVLIIVAAMLFPLATRAVAWVDAKRATD